MCDVIAERAISMDLDRNLLECMNSNMSEGEFGPTTVRLHLSMIQRNSYENILAKTYLDQCLAVHLFI